jgi:hypothetical protein
MFSRRARTSRQITWSRQKMLALLTGALLTSLVLMIGMVLAVVYALHPTQHVSSDSRTAATAATQRSSKASSERPDVPAADGDARDALAAAPMPTVDEQASHPAPISETDPGTPILLPAATAIGAADVPTGFPHTPRGALAQLAAIDQTAFQSGSLVGVRAVIAVWALPGGPTTTSWSGVTAMRTLLDAAGLSGGGSPQLALVLTPLMGQIKGSVGPDFVIPCIDFELDLTLSQTSRGAIADCQRMTWAGDRWLIGAGTEPATAPSVWPDTDTAINVGYRDLRHE